MLKSDFLKFVGCNVRVTFKDNSVEDGLLTFVSCYSYRFDFRHPNYFYLQGNPSNHSFKFSHIKKIDLLGGYYV